MEVLNSMPNACKTNKVNAVKLQPASPILYQNQIDVMRTLQQLHQRSIDEKTHFISPFYFPEHGIAFIPFHMLLDQRVLIIT